MRRSAGGPAGSVRSRAMPYPVRRIDHLPLEMDDGVVLSAAVFLPDAPGEWSAIIDAVPYRKDDDFLAGDWDVYGFIASRGFACVRIDLRGTGSSTGILENEYLAREQDDLVRAIALVARAAVVHRAGRHDRRLVGRLQRRPGRDAAAARAARDRADPLHGRPLPLRRPLRVRHAAGDRVGGLAGRDGGRDGAAAAPRHRRRRLGRDLARPARAHAAVADREAAPPAPRRLLEARLVVRGLGGDHVPGARHRRLDRHLPGRLPAAARSTRRR